LKKIASILLLGLLLFNWCGYRWVINVMQKQADTRLEARLDINDYDESQLIELKVPLNMPYQTDWAEFQRFDGEIEISGVHYKYVKRKIQDGQLVLKCIPNHARQTLESAKQDIFKANNDIQQDNGAKKTGHSAPTVVKNLLGDYDDLQPNYLQAPLRNAGTGDYTIDQPYPLLSSPHTTLEQPPEC